MGVSVTIRRLGARLPAASRAIGAAGRLWQQLSDSTKRRLEGWLASWARFRPPAVLLALAPLLLAPSVSPAALRDLIVGVLLFAVVERAVAELAGGPAGRLPVKLNLPVIAALSALAAAALHGFGLLLLVLLVAGCELARSERRTGLVAPVCVAVAAALRVDAGALLLGSDRNLLLPLVIGTGVLLVALAQARCAPTATTGPARGVGRGLLDWALLAAFALLLSLALALLTEVGLLAATPSLWAVFGFPLLALAGIAALAATDRPGPGAGRFGGLAALAASAWLVTMVLAVRLPSAG